MCIFMIFTVKINPLIVVFSDCIFTESCILTEAEAWTRVS